MEIIREYYFSRWDLGKFRHWDPDRKLYSHYFFLGPVKVHWWSMKP